MAGLLAYHGLELSEAMVFGLSGALMFAYLPFVRLGGLPLIAYRGLPRAIIRGVRRNLGVQMMMQTFPDPARGTAALNDLLDQGEVVGLQSSVFWLPYFPDDMRFHFNAHNLIVYGRDGDDYLISDPVFENPVRCPGKDLEKARFVRGTMAPKGLLYYPQAVPDNLDFKAIVPRIICKTARSMLRTPVPIAGIRGIHGLARAITGLRRRDRHYARLFLGHIVRMQEEIGTGGAGFRFIYASFLQEAGRLLKEPRLESASTRMTAVGDQWREFALLLARAIRRHEDQAIDFAAIREKLEQVAAAESLVYTELLGDCRL